MLTEIPAEQYSATVETVAREVLAEVEWYRPPVDALAIAERLGLVVARDSAMDVRARFVRLSAMGKGPMSKGAVGRTGRGTILLADDSRPERRQWAVAHEVSESIAQRVFVRMGVSLVDIPLAGRERVANHLASCLLLPREWLASDGEAVGWDLPELKQKYSTASHELIARRMLEMAPPVIVTLFDQGALQWRRCNVEGNAGGRPPSLTPAETSVWRAAFESGQATAYEESKLPEGISQIRCWPVHEPGWRREILRTEWTEW
ncbi:MAG: ImmA/IrrE family metallo-endopeptidase [Planctomycetes bacterium]|nr:ImmA/IrrE family metallo-endopeptidase [Planctomycetota bacterium]